MIRNFFLNTVFILSIILLSVLHNKAQKPPLIDTAFLIKECSALVPDSNVLRLKEHFFDSFILVNDTLGYLNPNGTLHLFEIIFKDSIIVNKLSISKYHGSNFNRHLFIHDNRIFSLGGSGLFNSFGKLIEFDFRSGEWFLKKIHNIPISSIGVVASWKNKSLLNVLFQLSDDSDNFSYGSIDLRSFTYEEEYRFEYDDANKLSISTGLIGYSNNRYSLNQYHYKNSPKAVIKIFDNKTGILSENTFYKDRLSVDGKSYAYVIDTMLYYRSKKNELDSICISETKNFSTINFPELYRKKLEKNKSISRFTYLLVGIIIILILSFFTFLSVKTPKSSFINNGLKDLENKLIIRKGVKLSRDELDEILGINHLNQDSTKTIRSRLINDINNQGKVIISRERNPKDKRFFDYHIS